MSIVRRLHLGAGGKRIPTQGQSWLTVDSRPETRPDYVGDVSDLSNHPSNSINEIYACHVLEHFPLAKTYDVLREWARVLVPQEGRLWLAVPDFNVIADLYILDRIHMERLRGLLYGGQDYPENFHHTAWDFETLACQLRECGYFNVRRSIFEWLPRPPVYRDFSFMELNDRYCSLNVEAIAI